MEIQTVCGILAVAAFLSVVLRQYRPEAALALGLLTGVGVLCVVLSAVKEPLETASRLLNEGGVDSGVIALMVKALGVCLLTQFTADVCRDAGESGLAVRAELAGKIALLLLALPVFTNLVELAALLMRGGDGT